MQVVYCKHCNEQLEVYEMVVPSYDDGGSVDGFDFEEHVFNCNCKGAHEDRVQFNKQFEDELPF